MKILNLANINNTEIFYSVSRFPDGQQQLKINNWQPLSNDYPVLIKSRLNDFKDLELIMCSIASLRELKVKEIHLFTPYFLGSRSDRKFENGSNNYLKDVICPIINNLKFESITCTDPHSDVLEACLNNFKKESNEEIVKFALSDIYDNDSDFGNDNIVIVSPDAGANKKVYKIAESIDFNGSIVTCSKDRGVDGKINKTIVPDFDLTKDVVIIDDICDGGATFINIANVINERRVPTDSGKLYLIVTHGIFSKGTDELFRHFNGIYSTNSYSDNKLIKQLNIF